MKNRSRRHRWTLDTQTLAMDPKLHHDKLLAAGRCGLCAERVSPVLIVRGVPCPHCDSDLRGRKREVLDDLKRRRLRWRITGYLLAAVASFFAGAIPLFQTVIQLTALFILHVMVLRAGLHWLSRARRIATRITIRIFGAAIATVSFLLNVAVAPFVGISAFVLGVAGLILTAVYIEISLFILRRRLRWEADDRSLQPIEWVLPALMGLMLLGAALATGAVIAGTIHLVATIEIPGISELAESMLEVVQ